MDTQTKYTFVVAPAGTKCAYERAIELGRLNDWFFREWDDRWPKEPIINFSDNQEVVKRIEALNCGGIRIGRVYKADEPESKKIEVPKIAVPKIELPQINIPWKEVGKAVAVGTAAVGAICTIGTVMMAAACTVLPAVLAVGAVAVLDPAYIVELEEDGTLLEIYSTI